MTNVDSQTTVEQEDIDKINQKWPIQMLPPMRIKQRPKFEFYNELKDYPSDIHEDSFLFVETRIDRHLCKMYGKRFPLFIFSQQN